MFHLADTGARSILVDADLRRPSMAECIGIQGGVGLTTVLIGRADVEDVVQPLGKTTLDLLPSGQIPPNPSELLGSPADSSPSLAVSDRTEIQSHVAEVHAIQ
jgi:polysaccharide biosynthesis transport protein